MQRVREVRASCVTCTPALCDAPRNGLGCRQALVRRGGIVTAQVAYLRNKREKRNEKRNRKSLFPIDVYDHLRLSL